MTRRAAVARTLATASPLAMLRRPGRVVAGALMLVTALGWWYLVSAPMPMPGAGGVWSAPYLLVSSAMWFLMMVAMMTPTVAPVVLLYDRVMERDAGRWHGRTAGFLGGYLLAWGGFSVAATAGQALLIGAGWVDAMGVATSRGAAAALLLLVAGYQWSAAKRTCLERCHSPLPAIVRQRRGRLPDFRAGAWHGAWCVGCCGLLMLLLFVGGVMNLAWVAVVTLLVAFEKLAPNPLRARQVLAVLAVAGAVGVLVAP